MATALVFGCTGKTGSQILSALLALPDEQLKSVATISRRPPKSVEYGEQQEGSRLNATVSFELNEWPTMVAELTPKPAIVFSALATTAEAAGSFKAQYSLEHDLNIALAREARRAGTEICVLISAYGNDANSMFSYSKMKAEIEHDILALDFKHTVIVRPTLIAGKRDDIRAAEAAIRWVAHGLDKISNGKLTNSWAHDAEVIGRAAVRAAMKAYTGELVGKITYIAGKDIMEMGAAPM